MLADRPVVLWRAVLLLVVGPVLVGGFAASALANRWIFALWAVAVAAAATLAVRRGFEVWSGRPGAAAHVADRALVILAPGTALFGLIVARHREALDLGWRAVWPSFYVPAATAPDTYLLIATGLALTGAVAWFVGKRAVARAVAERRHKIGGSNDG